MAEGRSLAISDYKIRSEHAQKIVPIDFDGALPQPTTDIDTAKADLKHAGYAILSDAVLPGKATTLHKIVADEIAREEAVDVNRVKGFFVDPDAKNRRLNRLPDRHPLFCDLIEDPVVIGLVKHILGPTILNESYLVQSLDANVTRPGSAAQLIHLDASNDTKHQVAPLHARFIFCLDDFDEENGATRIVPGSHLWNERIDMSGKTFYESVPAIAPAGSVIVYTDMLLHGTGANVSQDRARASINFGYCPPWVRPLINFPLVLDPKAIQGRSQMLRQLLGYSSVASGGDYPWESAREEVKALCVSSTRDY